MRLAVMNNTIRQIAAAVNNEGTYYLSTEELEQLKKILRVFSIISIICAVVVIAFIVVLIILAVKRKKQISVKEE